MKNKIEKDFKILAEDIVYYGYGMEQIITIFKNLQQRTTKQHLKDLKDLDFRGNYKELKKEWDMK